MRLSRIKIIDQLKSQRDFLYPVKIKRINQKVLKYGLDAVIEFSIQDGNCFEAAVVLSTTATPKDLWLKSSILANLPVEFKKKKYIPMVIAPYIGKKQSEVLLDAGISWIDLCGNMFIKRLPELYIERTDKLDRFPNISPIKKIYQGVSSLVSRALLLNPEGFRSLNQIVDFINSKNGSITIATVSKVLKFLEEELLVDKAKSKISLKKPEILVDNLAVGYADNLRKSRACQARYDIENINDLSGLLSSFKVEYAYCGFFAAQIKGLGVTEQITVLVKSLDDIEKLFKSNQKYGRADDAYGQAVFIENTEPFGWFNIQKEQFGYVVDDLELYLEMINDQPRGPKIANQLKERILEDFNG